MQIFAELPPKKHFHPIGKSERWAYIFEAVCTPKVRLCSPVADPWSMGEWLIRIRESQAKSDKSQFTNRIDFQLFSMSHSTHQSDYVAARIIWEVDKGLAHSRQTTLRFYAIPFTNSRQQAVNLMLSIVNLADD